MPNYCWVITADHLHTGEEWETDATGTYGPRGATLEQRQRALEHGREFTMHDDDGEKYYTGKLWTKNEPGTERDFVPLDDFGMPNAGCTEIRYNGIRL